MTSTSIERRSALLRELLAVTRPLEPILRELSAFPFDSDDELVTLTSADAVGVLERFVQGGLGAAEIEMWAEGIHMRDDVGLAVGADLILSEMLFNLSSPEISGEITTSVARQWIGLLDGRVRWSDD